MDDFRELVSAIQQSSPEPAVRLRQGVVQSVQSGSVTVTVGGGSTPLSGIKYLASYAPTANDTVWLATDGTDWLILGSQTGSSGGGGAASVIVSDTAPTAAAGSLWIRSTDMTLFVRYADADSTQWTEVRKAEDLGLAARITAVEARPLAGLVPVIPPTVSVSGGTATANTSGRVTFTSATSISLNDVFTQSYRNYRFILTASNTATSSIYYRMRTAGADNTSTNYKYSVWITRQDTTTVPLGATASTFGWLADTDTTLGHASGDIINPRETGRTMVNNFGSGRTLVSSYGTNILDISNAFSGITFFPAAGSFTGSVQIFAYNEGS